MLARFVNVLLAQRRCLVRFGLVIAVVAVSLLRWDGGAAFFLGLLAASIVGLVDGRVSVAAGLCALALCPLLLIANREAWLQVSTVVNYYLSTIGFYDPGSAADTVAIWAYYLLCIGVTAQIVRHVAATTGMRVGKTRWLTVARKITVRGAARRGGLNP